MTEQKKFYSNCLIEAIKAKLKSPRAIKLKYIPAHLNEVYCPHIMWHDGAYTYDFYVQGKLKWWQIFCHKGYIRKSECGYYEKCIKTLKKRGKRKGERK